MRDSILNENMTAPIAAFSVSLCLPSGNKPRASKGLEERPGAHIQACGFRTACHAPGEHLENAEKGKIFTPFLLALSLPVQVILSAWLSAQAVSCFLDIYLLHIHAFFSYHPPAWNTSSFQNPPGITFKTHLRSLAFPDASSSPLLQEDSAPPSVL